MDTAYQALCARVLERPLRETRNGPVHSAFGDHLECPLAPFPLLTTKRVFFRGVVEELAWFLRGSTNVQELRDKGVHIWDGNTEDRGWDAGAIYGFQWRHFGEPYKTMHSTYEGYDQIQAIIDGLRDNPHSRRHVLSGWAPGSDACLPPCHVLYQWYVEDGTLSVQMYQRSADLFLGVPFNIASTALLTYLIAHECDLTPGNLRIVFGDVHIYGSHVEAVKEQLERVPRPLPTLEVHREKDGLWNVKMEDVTLSGYKPHPRIKAKMIV